MPSPSPSIFRVTPVFTALLLLLVTSFGARASAPLSQFSSAQLPTAVTADLALAKSLTVRGNAVMRFFGLKVYDIRLWTASKPYAANDFFALELEYDLKLNGKEIAKRSVEEMKKQGYTDEAALARWLGAMTRIFPDVKAGDILVGVNVPTAGARFYLQSNGQSRFVGEVAEPAFATAFFDIWLSDKTSEPRLRTRLLGEAK
jgi:hypothetical protein